MISDPRQLGQLSRIFRFLTCMSGIMDCQVPTSLNVLDFLDTKTRLYGLHKENMIDVYHIFW